MENSTNYIDKENIWDRKKTIVSKTDCSGNIVYTNNMFSQTSGYDRVEIIGESENITNHPDMPKVIFNQLRKSFDNKETNYAIIKEQSRDGKDSWVFTSYTVDKNNMKKTIGYTSRKLPVPKAVIDFIEPIYKKLLDIELVKGIKSSEQYLNCLLKVEHNKTYENLVIDLFKKYPSDPKKNLWDSYLNNFLFSTYV